MSSSTYRRLSSLFNSSTSTSTSTTGAAATKLKLKLKPPPKTDSSPSYRVLNNKTFVEKFKKASESVKFRLRRHRYQEIVLRLAAAKKFSSIENILEHQKKYKDITDERFTVRLISLYGKAGMFDHAHKLFEEMPQLNCERTVMSFNALIAACVNSKKFEKISEFFRELPGKLSIEPNTVSYNTVTKAFCEMGSLDSALLVMDEMAKNGMEPNLITFNTLLDAFYRHNRFSEAEKLWVLMERKNIVPDVRSYNSKLRGLVADDRISEAVELIEEMGSKGLKPDVYSFNVLIEGFCDKNNLEEAKRWYGEMAKNDCAPDCLTFRMLIPLVSDDGDFLLAFELCKKAISRQRVVDLPKMQRVVDGLVKESRIEEAKELVELGKKNNYFHYKLKMLTD